MPRAAGGGDPECIGLADLAPGGKARWVQAGLAVHPGLTWSPDEGSLALSCSGRRTRRDQLAVYDVGLGTVRLLKSGLRGETIVAPSWSPTGEWIAFLRLGRTCALWLVRPDGSEERRVPTTGDVSVGTPRWSPDGKELYYLAEHPSEGAVVRDAFVARVSAPGGQCEALTHALRPHEMWLSPDGQYLLCHVACGARSADLYHLVPTATSARIHAVVLPFAAPGAAIAPDSKRIVFLDRVRTPGQDLRRPFSVGGDVFFMAEERYRLRAVPVAGGQGDQIIGDASGLAWDNAWTAQHQIVFTRDDNTSLWVADDDGTHERKVSGLE
jgi:dipeptidyl aminopeptidase/acylaminoacyl peptidase